MRQRQFWGILKGAPNADNAQKFVDFALQPRVQAELAKYIPYGPTNKKAFGFISKADAAKLPSSPEHYKISFDQSAQWWVDHLSEVTLAWQKWLISG
jgi:putative spermidine/putrescine transport system substrate-binding protein